MAVAHRPDRVFFTEYKSPLELSDLIEVQKQSYRDFLQLDVPPHERKMQGLHAVLSDSFPIVSQNGLIHLEYVSYSLSQPRNEPEECLARGLTYAASLKLLLRLVHYQEIGAGHEKAVSEMREQEVFLCELPLMTEAGSFIINGAERVVVSQLHKSPGVSFEMKEATNGKEVLCARLIPYNGPWLEFEYDQHDVLWLTVDRRAKILATTFLRAFGYEDGEEILNLFYETETVTIGRTRIKIEGKAVEPEALVGRYAAQDVVDMETGEVLVDAGTELKNDDISRLMNSNLNEFKIIKKPRMQEDYALARTLARDKVQTAEDAYRAIYTMIRPGDPVTDTQARNTFQRMFHDPARYDLAPVGRYKINRKFGLEIPQNQRTLTREDIVRTLQYLIKLRRGEGVMDDIDHLGNRRVRAVGELLANQMRIGLQRMDRTIRERMTYRDDQEQMTPQTLVNPKPVQAAVKDFFGRGQLSQFMDQINPLAELTHKRRLSALGPGGLNRDRAGFEVRDVHPTHYGRICPIETPEGPNIGLMASLATYARLNEYGFIETPYLRVENGRVTGEIEWLSAYEEDQYVIAQANAPLDAKGRFTEPRVLCRHRGDFPQVPPEKVDYMDISPMQMVSVAAALIPFLEHDDANRALMGSNMQRQAVPLLRAEAPLVGTGLERVVARNSGTVVRARHDGIVEYADSEVIRIRITQKKTDNPFREEEDEYLLRKYQRSNQNTCINQRPLVKAGDKVKAGDVIADGPATDHGELALGKNLLVAFLPWEGYNFEDAIIISEELLKEDTFTSIHIDVFEIDARDTKLGPEEITRDIPNMSEDVLLRQLDENGIIRIGAKVHAGDILVGKVTPRGETELTPEEKLLRAVFGDKAEDVRNASLEVPAGVEGIVVDVKVTSRKGKDQDPQRKRSDKEEENRIKRFYDEKIQAIRERFVELTKEEVAGLKILEDVYDPTNNDIAFEKGKRLRIQDLKEKEYALLARLRFEDEKIQNKFLRLVNLAALEEEKWKAFRESKLDRLKKGDELPPGVIKNVKVYVASRRAMSVGDKMAGRHGNKGVVAKVVPVEDMPFLPDGTPIQILLNPLGVPSRMNVGQILETHLGWAAKALGLRVATPVFQGVKEGKIFELLKKAGLPENGKIRLRDGRTGEPLHQDTCVGQIYMMKLNHLVDDKMHARAIGPYSLVTQQPLGGKAQFGGQRFGEMEVWALEAYGAAHTLQELLTIKSDDIPGRSRTYESIVRGECDIEPGVPESFNVLVKEMQGLCLDVIKLVRVETYADTEEEETEELDLLEG